MDWLEKEKKVLSGNEAVTSEIVASAHIENYAMKLFEWADKEDRAARFGKNRKTCAHGTSNQIKTLNLSRIRKCGEGHACTEIVRSGRAGFEARQGFGE